MGIPWEMLRVLVTGSTPELSQLSVNLAIGRYPGGEQGDHSPFANKGSFWTNSGPNYIYLSNFF